MVLSEILKLRPDSVLTMNPQLRTARAFTDRNAAYQPDNEVPTRSKKRGSTLDIRSGMNHKILLRENGSLRPRRTQPPDSVTWRCLPSTKFHT